MLTCCAYMPPAMRAGLSATPGCCCPVGPRAWPPRGPAPCCCRPGAPCCMATGGMPACGGTTTGTAVVAAGLAPAAAAANEPGRCTCGCPAAGMTGSGAADLEGCGGCGGAAGAAGRGAATAGLPAGGAGGCTGCGIAGCAARCCSLTGTTSVGSMSPNLMEGCLPAQYSGGQRCGAHNSEGRQSSCGKAGTVHAVHAPACLPSAPLTLHTRRQLHACHAAGSRRRGGWGCLFSGLGRGGAVGRRRRRCWLAAGAGHTCRPRHAAPRRRWLRRRRGRACMATGAETERD